MRVLDMTAGNRAIWFNKSHPDVTYIDIRPEVDPDVLVDARALPPDVKGEYDLIVFDPPHVNSGAQSNTSKSYGHHTAADIRSFVAGAAREAWRMSRVDALMAFKWNDHDQSLVTILRLMAPWWEPLFGQKTAVRTKHSCQTQWVMLRRRTAA